MSGRRISPTQGHAVFPVNARMRAGAIAALHPPGVKPTPPAAGDHEGSQPGRVFGHLPGGSSAGR